MATPKLDIKLSNGDITFTGGIVDLVTGVDQVVQEIDIRLKLFRGELFWDTDAGMPYYQYILDKAPLPDGSGTVQPTTQMIQGIFLDEINSIDSVEKITDFDINLDSITRSVTMDISVVSSEGVVDVSEVYP